MRILIGTLLVASLGAGPRHADPVFAMPVLCFRQPAQDEAGAETSGTPSSDAGPGPEATHPREEAPVPCLAGTHAAGLPVTLLGKDGTTTAAVTGGAALQDEINGGDRTLVSVMGADPLSSSWFLAVMGPAPASFRVPPRVPVTDGQAVAAVKASIARSGIFAQLRKLGSLDPSAEAVEKSPREVFRFRNLPGDVVFARYRVQLETGVWDFGPLVVVEHGKPTSPFTICSAEPLVFSLGSSYFLYGGSRCCECGGATDEVFRVADGRLRRVFQTAALSD